MVKRFDRKEILILTVTIFILVVLVLHCYYYSTQIEGLDQPDDKMEGIPTDIDTSSSSASLFHINMNKQIFLLT